MRRQTSKAILIAISVAFVLGNSAHAKPTRTKTTPEAVYQMKSGAIGLGAMIGTMGSVSAKYWFDANNATDVGVEFLEDAWKVFYIDYYYHLSGLFGTGTRFGRETAPYIEFGGGGGFWSRREECGRWKCQWNTANTGSGNAFFVRILAGLEWFPRRTSISVFAEAGPSYLWVPIDGDSFDAAIGGRFYF